MKKALRIGIIGLGRWGTNYLRTFNGLENCTVGFICASHKQTLKEAIENTNLKKSPKTAVNYRILLEDKNIDAVAIATNGASHYKIAKEALKSGKHVIVEKPLAFSSANAEELIRISDKTGKILMAGHQHLYNPGIQRLKKDINKGLFGKIDYFSLFHCGNGPVRSDMSALWDFFPHTVSILLYLTEKSPLRVSANGACYIKDGIEDIVTMDIAFPDKIFAASTGTWLHPLKKMNVAVVGEKLYAVFDDYSKEEKLKYYPTRPGISKGKAVIPNNGHDMPYTSPKLSGARPLTVQLSHFLHCIEAGEVPLTDGKEALKVTKVLEAAQKSLHNNGKMTQVPA